MTKLQVAYDEDQNIATVLNTNEPAPVGSENLGTITHTDPVYPESSELQHKVRDLLRGYIDEEKVGSIEVSVTPGTGTYPVTSIRVLNSMYNLRLNSPDQATAQLSVEAWPPSASLKKLEFRSSDKEVVTVDEEGVITAVGVGGAVIIITAPGSEKGTLNTEVGVFVGSDTAGV